MSVHSLMSRLAPGTEGRRAHRIHDLTVTAKATGAGLPSWVCNGLHISLTGRDLSDWLRAVVQMPAMTCVCNDLRKSAVTHINLVNSSALGGFVGGSHAGRGPVRRARTARLMSNHAYSQAVTATSGSAFLPALLK